METKIMNPQNNIDKVYMGFFSDVGRFFGGLMPTEHKIADRAATDSSYRGNVLSGLVRGATFGAVDPGRRSAAPARAPMRRAARPTRPKPQPVQPKPMKKNGKNGKNGKK